MTGFKDLRQFIQALEERGELCRIREEVNSHLQITEITDRVSKQGGPALLFENVKGFDMPVLINSMGSWDRIAMSLGCSHFDQIENRIGALLDTEIMKKGLFEKMAFGSQLLKVASTGPKIVSNAPCQEVVLMDDQIDLNRIPILHCWPQDAGRFITLPMVISKDPDNNVRNVGMYRMQVIDKKSTFMHWQTQKDGAVHSYKAGKFGDKIEIAVAMGSDPATMMSAIVPLPYGVDEFLLSGFIRSKSLDLVKCKTVDLEVPANSEIVLEGYVDLKDIRTEGPFGDHTGVYTPPEPFPVFHVTCMTHRKNPIYCTTIVGKPPMEDYYMGKAIEKMFLPILKKQLPELVDMNFPMEGTFNNAVIVSIDKQYPFQARKIAHAIWGLGQLSYTKVVIVVGKDVDVHNLSEVTLNVFNNIDPKRDVFFVEGPVDTLNHASPERDFGSKMGIDATIKTKEEGYQRQWPETIEMDDKTKKEVDSMWDSLKIKS